MGDVVVPRELVDARRAAEAAMAAVGAWTEGAGGSLQDQWAEALKAAEAFHALRAPLVAEHGSFAVTHALGLAMREDAEA